MEGVLVDHPIDVFEFAGAFPVAVADAARLEVLISFEQANLACGIETAAPFRNFDAIGQQRPAVEAQPHVAFGHINAQLTVNALLIGGNDGENRLRWGRAGPRQWRWGRRKG